MHHRWYQCHLDYQRNKAWPEPFLEYDRHAVRDPFRIMESNGWRRQNLLGAHHFDPETGGLTRAGKIRANWILTQAPVSRRTIFVERGANIDATATRVDIVQQYAVQVMPEGQLPDIQETHLIAEGRPAEGVDALRTRYSQTAPSPQLPAPVAEGD